MFDHISAFRVAVALSVVSGLTPMTVYSQKKPPVREITPEAERELAAVALVNGPRPVGGYLYPDRVGERWAVTKKFHYGYGVPVEVMSQWAPYVMPPPSHDPRGLARDMARLQDEDPERPGFQTTVDGQRYTLDQRLYDLGAASVRAFGAKGDGRSDDTDAVQLAIDFSRDNMLVCWFPTGDYLVSRTLRGYHLHEIWGNGTLHAAHANHICLVGPSHGRRARIVLKEGTFPRRIPGQNRFVIWTQYLCTMRSLGSKRTLKHTRGPLGDNASASFFCPAIRHLDIVVRPNNAGASGLYFVAAEHSTLRDVRVVFEPNRDGSSNGEAGFCGLPGSGGSAHNLAVHGGAVGIDLNGVRTDWAGRPMGPWAGASTRPAPTLSNSEFVGQTGAAIRGQAQGTLTMVGCRFAMGSSNPAIQMSGKSPESTPAVIDSVFEYPAGTSAAAVVKTGEGMPGFYLENCYVKNAAGLDASGAYALRKAGWFHVQRAARTRRDRQFSEPLRMKDEQTGEWLVWKRSDPRCTVQGKQTLFDGKPVRLPEKASWQIGLKGKKPDPDLAQVTMLLGEPVVVDGRVTFSPLMQGRPVGPGSYWQKMRRSHNYRRELGFDTPGLVSVKDFGAVGDGKADDTDALSRAVASGKDLLLPRGAYQVTRTVQLNPGQTVVGMDKCWSLIVGAQTPETVFGGALRNSAAGRKALDTGVPVVATATGDTAFNTLCDLGVYLNYGYPEAKTREDARISGFLLLVQGGGCEAVDLQLKTRKNWWKMTAEQKAQSPYGGYKAQGRKAFMQHPLFQVAAGGGLSMYNGCFCGGHKYPRDRAYLQIRNTRHPVRFYHLQIQTPVCFGLRMEGSTGGMRAYGIKSEHGTHCLLYAENSRNFGWYGYGAGGAPRPERSDYDGLPPAHYRVENCDDFLIAAYSQRVQHPNFLTYDGIREVRGGRVLTLQRCFRPILYLRGNPRYAAERTAPRRSARP